MKKNILSQFKYIQMKNCVFSIQSLVDCFCKVTCILTFISTSRVSTWYIVHTLLLYFHSFTYISFSISYIYLYLLRLSYFSIMQHHICLFHRHKFHFCDRFTYFFSHKKLYVCHYMTQYLIMKRLSYLKHVSRLTVGVPTEKAPCFRYLPLPWAKGWTEGWELREGRSPSRLSHGQCKFDRSWWTCATRVPSVYQRKLEQISITKYPYEAPTFIR